MIPPAQHYDKPALNENDLIERYIERGLTITDRNRTARYLRHIGYYRLPPTQSPSRPIEPPTPSVQEPPSMTFSTSMYLIDNCAS